jgi:hypothetical protein
MQSLMVQNRNPSLRAYFVWGPFLRGDTEAVAKNATEKYAAPGSVYFWTPSIDLGRDLALTLRMPYGRLAWDVYLAYRRGTLWEGRIPAPAYWQHQLDILQGDRFNPTLFEARAMLLADAR